MPLLQIRVTRLESTLMNFVPTTLLESTLAKTAFRTAFRMNTYKKQRGRVIPTPILELASPPCSPHSFLEDSQAFPHALPQPPPTKTLCLARRLPYLPPLPCIQSPTALRWGRLRDAGTEAFDCTSTPRACSLPSTGRRVKHQQGVPRSSANRQFISGFLSTNPGIPQEVFSWLLLPPQSNPM